MIRIMDKKKNVFNVKAMGKLSTADMINLVANRVKEAGVDITGDYKQWLNICFAISHELGEGGRDLFRQISQFSDKYDYKKCEELYNDCMKRLQRGDKGGITIGTFFKYVKDAGIDITPPTAEECQYTTPHITPITPVGQMGQTEQMEQMEQMEQRELVEAMPPTFSDRVQALLPSIIQDIAALGDSIQQKDMLIATALVLLSGCFPKVWANYDGRLVFSNLFFFLVAPPASNKGIVSSCLQLVMLIEQEIRECNQREMEEYNQQMAELKASKSKAAGTLLPTAPPYRSLLISGNASSTAIYEDLANNNGEGITIETEADSLSTTLKSDYGNFSDGLRKAFHHERISYSRRANKEHVCINNPKWSVMLTGTPGQVTNLIPSSENGLFSRFLFLLSKREGAWRNVFSKKECTIDEAMTAIGKRVYEIHKVLKQAGEKGIEFTLTKGQENKFNDYFDKLYQEYGSMMGEDFEASIFRLGLSTFRIAMVLSITRQEGITTPPQQITCGDKDVEAAILIAETLIQHAAHIFSNLMPSQDTETTASIHLSGLHQKLYDALPDTFSRQQALALGPKIGMEPKTANKYIGHFVTRYHICRRVKNGLYEKVKNTEN